MERYNIISGLFWIGVGIIFCIGSLRLGLFDEMPQAGLFPFIMAFILASLSIFLLLMNIVGIKKKKTIKDKLIPEKGIFYKLLFSVLSLFSYIALLEVLGFLFTTFLFIFFLIKFIAGKKYFVSIYWAFFTSSISYLLFVLGLNVRLP